MTEAAAGEPKVRRWTAQRWALDNVLRSVGIDWDQPRSFYLNAACGIEGGADFAAIRERVKKYADIEPAFANTARRRRRRLVVPACMIAASFLLGCALAYFPARHRGKSAVQAASVQPAIEAILRQHDLMPLAAAV